MRKAVFIVSLAILLLVSCTPDPDPKPMIDNYMDIRNNSGWTIQVNVRPTDKPFDGTYTIIDFISGLMIITQQNTEYLLTYRIMGQDGKVSPDSFVTLTTTTQETSIRFRLENYEVICEIEHK